MSKASLENALRAEALEVVKEALTAHYDLDPKTQICVVNTGELAIPVVDAEKNEKFVLIKVTIPRGTRNAEGSYDEYNGYAAADDYKADLERRQAKKDASAAKKEAAAKAREAKREAKKTIKELNKKGLDKMIHKQEGE